MHKPTQHQLRHETRRHFFRNCGVGVGKIALATLLGNAGGKSARGQEEDQTPFEVRPTHFPARAKRVIYLFMAGAPSQLETFDYKPKLTELEPKRRVSSITTRQRRS